MRKYIFVILSILLASNVFAHNKMLFDGVKIPRNANRLVTKLEKQMWSKVEDGYSCCHLVGKLGGDTASVYILKNANRISSVHVVANCYSSSMLDNDTLAVYDELVLQYGSADETFIQSGSEAYQAVYYVWHCKNGDIKLRKQSSSLGNKISLIYSLRHFPRDESEHATNIIKVDCKRDFKNQFIVPNSVYEIDGDLDLGGEVLCVPANSVIRFIRGRILNGVVVFNNTTLINPAFANIIKYEGKIANKIIDAAQFPCNNDLSLLTFLFKQIESNKTIRLENRRYRLDWRDIPLLQYSAPTLNGRLINKYSWFMYEDIHHVLLDGNGARIEILNTTTRRYEDVFLFMNTSGLCVTNLEVVGDSDYYQTGQDYGVNFIQFLGDNTDAYIDVCASNISMPVYSGDYYGNDGSVGLFNSDIIVRGSGLKYGSRIHFANNCKFIIENTYGHRGLYLGGGIYDSQAYVRSKYMDTSAAVLLSATPVNGIIKGACNVYISTYDTGTVSDNVSILPGRVYINSLGGDIDNKLFDREYNVYFTDITILARYSPNTDISTNYTPLIFDTQEMNEPTGRDFVPCDVKEIKCTMILEDGISTSMDRTSVNVLTNYNGINDSVKLDFFIVNNSSNKNLVYTGYIHCQDDLEVNISSDQRFTVFQWASNSSYDVPLANYSGRCRINFVNTKEVLVATVPESRTGIATFDNVYLENVQSFCNRGPGGIVIIK